MEVLGPTLMAVAILVLIYRTWRLERRVLQLERDAHRRAVLGSDS